MNSNSFSAVRERVLSQQATRESSRFIDNPNSEPNVYSPLLRVTPYLHSIWSIIQSREGTRPVFRVGQVDAEQLDEELLQLLKGQAGEALKYYGSHLQDDWVEEILLGLRLILFKLSIWDNDASYGAALQNLRYADARVSKIAPVRPSRIQKGLYGFLTTFGRYGWNKWENWLRDQEGGYTSPSQRVQILSRFTNWASNLHSLAAFVSFLIFLVNGRYRTLLDRLLRLRLIAPNNQVGRQVSFEYLNRQLVWHAFTEFLLFVLPLLGINRWRRWLNRVWKRTKIALNSNEETDEKTTGPLAFLPERTCAICYQDQNPTTEAEILGANTSGGGFLGSAMTDVVNPYETIPCGCIYCFVCIASKLEAEEGHGWTCLRCGENVKTCRPWLGDVIFPKKETKSMRKTVEFVELNDSKEKEKSYPLELDDSMNESDQWTQIERS